MLAQHTCIKEDIICKKNATGMIDYIDKIGPRIPEQSYILQEQDMFRLSELKITIASSSSLLKLVIL
jgi:hypothetical protein